MIINSMEVEEAFKSGSLFVPSQTFLRKSWTKKICALYKASNFGIQRLEIFDSEDAFLKLSSSKIIPLTECVKATATPQKQQANVFEVRTKTHTYQFSADTFQEMTEWLGALQTVAFGLARPISGLNLNTLKEVKHEENMLYSSMDEPEVYSVKALETEAILRSHLKGEYKLIITSVSLSLAEDGPLDRAGRIIYTWPYRHIRRYGCSKDNFSFEAGRKCASGEGLFTFATKDGSHIFQSVDAHVTSLKTSQTDADGPASPSPKDEKGNAFAFGKDSQDSYRILPHAPKRYGHNDASASEHTSVRNQNTDTVHKKHSIKGVTTTNSEDGFAKSNNPIAKPPRKSKPKPEINFSSQERNENSISLARVPHVDTNSKPSVYEEPISYKNCSEIQPVGERNVYFEPEEDFTRVPKSQEANNSSVPSDPAYAILEENLSNNVTASALADQLKRAFPSHEKASSNMCFSSDSDSYDHLSLKNYHSSRYAFTNKDSDHIYGKLLPSGVAKSVSVSEAQPTPVYGSLQSKKRESPLGHMTNDKDHSYINVQVANSVGTSVLSIQDEEDLHHFVQNDVEYAQVFKKNK